MSEITVISRSYDGCVRRTWKAELVTVKGPLIEILGKFDDDIDHPNLGLIRKETISREFFWLDRWYNVFLFYEPARTFRNAYCNIAMPPKFEHDTVDYIDLEIDMIIWPDGRREVLDQEIFEESSVIFPYSEEVNHQARSAFETVSRLAEEGSFPFDLIGLEFGEYNCK